MCDASTVHVEFSNVTCCSLKSMQRTTEQIKQMNVAVHTES